MCYSAQIQAAYMKYLRETGAEMDVDQIKTFIDQYREAKITKLEREVFIQRKRLADAESKRIAGNKVEQAMTRLERLKATKPHVAEARIFPMHYAPIVLQDGDRRVMRLGRYHCRKPGEREDVDRQLPGLYNARRDSLGKYWQELFGVSHAVMMVESFFENVEREGKNQVLHFVPRPKGTMLIACLAATWQDPKGGRPLLSFATITGHDRMIINLKPEHLDAWLEPQGKSLEELQAIPSARQAPYYEHEVMAA